MSETQLDGTQPFCTNEKVLAFCLYAAGCQMVGDGQYCINLFDEEILFKLGGGQRDPRSREVIKPSRFSGMSDWDAAQLAWKEKAEGHVEYQFILTQECHDLIKAYRDQREKLKDGEGKFSEMARDIMLSAVAGAMLPTEALLRLTCVIVKSRPEFMTLWQSVTPVLHRSTPGRSKTYETTARVSDRNGSVKTVPATGVKSPGYNRISLNAGEKLRKKLGFL